MYPYLFDWVIMGRHFSPPTYGVLLAIAFSTGYFIAIKRAEKIGENTLHVENLFLLVVAASVVGSRLFHVFFEEFSYYLANPIKILAVWEGGYTFYGALIAGIFTMYTYCHVKKVSFLQFCDIGASATTLGLASVRMGCFMAGCCWGRPTDMPWAVTFSHPNTFATLRNVPLHPTQIYEAAGALAIFLYLQWRWKDRKYVGQIFFHSLVLYSILRFTIELFRGDEYRGYVFNNLISYSQLVSLVILPFALTGIALYSKRRSVS